MADELADRRMHAVLEGQRDHSGGWESLGEDDKNGCSNSLPHASGASVTSLSASAPCAIRGRGVPALSSAFYLSATGAFSG